MFVIKTKINQKLNKKGFTLAETLVTLAIIGVIAAITLPALIANTQERQAIASYKKAMNTLNMAVQLNVAKDGFDFSSIINNTKPAADNIYAQGTDMADQSVWGILATKAMVDISATTSGKEIPGDCKGESSGDMQLYQIFFTDGTALCYRPWTADNLTYKNMGIRALIDINGLKGPNKQSACDDADCLSGKKIRDQFLVTLMDGSVFPGAVSKTANGYQTSLTSKEGYASLWAISH